MKNSEENFLKRYKALKSVQNKNV